MLKSATYPCMYYIHIFTIVLRLFYSFKYSFICNFVNITMSLYMPFLCCLSDFSFMHLQVHVYIYILVIYTYMLILFMYARVYIYICVYIYIYIFVYTYNCSIFRYTRIYIFHLCIQFHRITDSSSHSYIINFIIRITY